MFGWTVENGCGVRATYRSIVLGSVFVCDIISPTLLSFFFSVTDRHTHTRNLSWFLPTLTFSCKYLPFEWPKLGLSCWRLIQDIDHGPLWGWSAASHFFWHSSMEELSHVCLCGGKGFVCVCVCECFRRWSRRVWGRGRLGLKKQERLLLSMSPVPSFLAVNLIRKNTRSGFTMQAFVSGRHRNRKPFWKLFPAY